MHFVKLVYKENLYAKLCIHACTLIHGIVWRGLPSNNRITTVIRSVSSQQTSTYQPSATCGIQRKSILYLVGSYVTFPVNFVFIVILIELNLSNSLFWFPLNKKEKKQKYKIKFGISLFSYMKDIEGKNLWVTNCFYKIFF